MSRGSNASPFAPTNLSYISWKNICSERISLTDKKFLVHRLLKMHSSQQSLLTPPNHVTTNDDVWNIFVEACQATHDETETTATRTSSWHLRDHCWESLASTASAPDEYLSDVGYVLFAKSVSMEKHQTVTPNGIEQVESEYDNPRAEPMRILFLAERELVLVESNSRIMSSKKWQKMLELILSNAAAALGFTSELRLEPIPSLEEEEEALRSFEKVTQVRISIRLPNPDRSELYADLEDLLRKSRINEADMILQSQSDTGIDLDEPDGLAAQSVAMSNAGYKNRELEFIGQDEEGEEKRYKPGTKQLELTVPVSDDPTVFAASENIIRRIMQSLQQKIPRSRQPTNNAPLQNNEPEITTS